LSSPKRFLVSGGSGGIGAAVCHELAAHGFRPIVGYHRNKLAAHEVAARCEGHAVHLDLSSGTSIHEAVEQIQALLATDDVPLAGVILCGSPPLALAPFGKITSEEMMLQLQVNVIGPQHLLAELVRRCFRKNKDGVVVGVLSQAMGAGAHNRDDATRYGHGVASGMGAYVIAKYGMAGLLELLAADYPWLRVRSVKPGYTETRMLQVFDERFLALQRERQEFTTPQHVASLIVEEALAP
jgi:NAD(P)-dependent dehydrogenase (short-subunit alcohol dehydrogenase family)